MKTAENIKISGPNGNLAAIVQRPDKANDRVPVVALCHGFTSSKEDPIIHGLANLLQEKGIASIRFDFDGHGESDGLLKNMTISKEIKDLEAVIKWIKTQPWAGALAIAGHSQGGVITELTAGELGKKLDISAIAMLSAAAIVRDNSLMGFLFWEKFDPSNPPETLTVKGDKVVGRNYLIENQSLPIYETARKWNGPVCLIHGTGDSIVPYTYSEHFKELWQQAELHLIEGADHLYSKDDDMQKAIRIAADFLEKQLYSIMQKKPVL